MAYLSKGNLYITVILFLLSPSLVFAKALSLVGYSQHPYYWTGMIASLPREAIPEASFKEIEMSDTEASLLFRKALSSFQEKSYKKTIEQLREMTVRFPQEDITQYAYYLIGDCYSRMAETGDEELLKEAVSAYLKAVTTYPASEEAPRGLYQAGRGLFLQGFYYEAIAQMNRISLNYPNSLYLHKGMIAKGVILFYQKKYRLSESVLEKVLNSDALSDEEKRFGKLWLGNSLHMDGQYEKAGEIYKAVNRDWPEFVKESGISLLLMGENLLTVGDYAGSLGLFDIYVTSYPDSTALPAVILRAGDVYRSEGKKEEASKNYSTVVSNYSSYDVAIIGKARIAEIEIEKGSSGTGEALLRDVLLMKGNIAREAALIIVEALKKAGISLEAANGYRAILDHFGKISDIDLKGKMAESLRDAIVSYYDKKDCLSALKTYHEDPRLLKDRIREPKFFRMIGDCYMEIGLPEKAASQYEELLTSKHLKDLKTLSGTFREETLYRVINAYLKAGNSVEAGRAIKRMLAEFQHTRFKSKLDKISDEITGRVKEDGTSISYFKMAKRSLEGKRFKEAVDYFRKVVKLKDPSLLASAYIGLGDSFFGMEKYGDAISAYETGKTGGGEMGNWAGYRIGESYLKLGDLHKAMAAFQAVVRDNKGVYGKMAGEELKRVEMEIKSQAKAD